MGDDDSLCPECDSRRIRAGTNKTECVECGATFQSGLQGLAQRFSV